MRFFGTILFLTLLQACDPYGFGFKNNPAYVLDKAFNSVQNLDTDSFNSDEETKVKARMLAGILGYKEVDRIAHLRSVVSLDYKSLQWL